LLTCSHRDVADIWLICSQHDVADICQLHHGEKK
jgi:hypothetical protein